MTALCCCCSVTQPHPTLCDPGDCSMPGFPVLNYLPEFAQTLVHCVGDGSQPSRALLLPSIFPSFRVFPVTQLFISGPCFDSRVGKNPWRRDRLMTPVFWGFPCGSAGKESTCNARDLGSIPGLGRSPGKEKGYPTPSSILAWRVP